MVTKADIQRLKELSKSRFRREQSLFIAEGEKLSMEIIKSHFKVKEIYLLVNKYDNDFLNEAKIAAPKAIIEIVSDETMSRISQLKTHTPYLITAEIPTYNINDANPKESLTLALDCVQDPGNIGTIIRIADWFGIRDIFCSEDCADIFSSKVVQATMGAITRVRVHYINLPKLLKEHSDINIYGTFLDGKNIYNTPLSQNGIIVMGNEGKGISKEVEEVVNSRLYIPPFPANTPTSESLNVAIATGIIVAEFRRV